MERGLTSSARASSVGGISRPSIPPQKCRGTRRFKRCSNVAHKDPTGWLGRQDSNLCISMQGWLFEASKDFPRFR
jgi:hypothetical protein